MIKKNLLPITYILGLFLYFPFMLSSQISEGGIPPSFEHTSLLKSAVAARSIPIDFSVEDLKTVDAWKVSQGAPLKVATILPAELNLQDSGQWVTLANGQKVCQLRIQAKNAIALMLYYKRFYIPQGGKLFIYNMEKSQVLGAYTYQTNPPKTSGFATEFIAGDDLILEYVPAESGEEPQIEIEGIGYGYNHLYISHNASSLKSTSGSCQVNINCEEGNAWQAEKKGVCHTIQKIGNSSYICSASLLNNTAEDLKPYILSAYHCSMNESTVASAADMEKWAFYFHLERESCDNTSLPIIYKTMVGCKRIAYTPIQSGSDGLLLLLNTSIPESYNVYYNGWDRRDTPAQSGVSIHHPQGDYKKISTFNKPAKSYTFNGTNGTTGTKNAHWDVIFVETTNGHSITEGGSSGSPLFNESKLVVGSLTGGNSECTIPEGDNLYGKLSYHWDKYPTDSTRMDIYLDPIGKGSATTLAGRYANISNPTPTNLTVSFANQKVTLNWTAPVTSLSVSYYNVYANNTFIGSTETTGFVDSSPEYGSQTYSVSAVYSDGNESSFVFTSIYITEYKQPTDLTAKRINATEITLNWKAPVYTQNIYWRNDEDSLFKIGFGGTPFYFGQRWDKTEIASLHKKTIISVNFIPMENTDYVLYITQGGEGYRQTLTNLKIDHFYNVVLTTPFVLDSSKNLIVSFYASKYGEKDYPAIIDNGPSIAGKGDIFSLDGTTWESLYDNDFDNNFYLSAILSSEEGELKTSSYSSALSIQKSKTSKTALLKSIPSSLNESIKTTSTSQSSLPAAFPELTGYKIYRDNNLISTIPPNPTQYTDKNIDGSDHIYYVTALYGTEEGKESDPVPVANENIDLIKNQLNIVPTIFSNQVQLISTEEIRQVSIYSSAGRLALQIDFPSDVIDTSSLPVGNYFFRLQTKGGETKIIKGIKKR